MHVVLVAESFIKVFHYIKSVTLFFFSALPSGHLAHISGEAEVLLTNISKNHNITVILQLLFTKYIILFTYNAIYVVLC